MNILKEREKTHGDYNEVARVSQALKLALRNGPIEEVPAVIRESLELICMKMARIVCGDHNEPDHYLDIKGYAQLALTKHIGIPGKSNRETPDEPIDPSVGDYWDYVPPAYR
jgi:hypothetical protein